MNPAALRLRTTRRISLASGPRALASVRADYQVCYNTIIEFRFDVSFRQVPFPLSQLFTPTSMGLRAEVFAFLLGLQHARKAVTATLQLYDGVPKSFSFLRHRLTWLIQ